MRLWTVGSGFESLHPSQLDDSARQPPGFFAGLLIVSAIPPPTTKKSAKAAKTAKINSDSRSTRMIFFALFAFFAVQKWGGGAISYLSDGSRKRRMTITDPPVALIST